MADADITMIPLCSYQLNHEPIPEVAVVLIRKSGEGPIRFNVPNGLPANKVPLPKSSLTIPTRRRMAPYPKPFPTPSRKEGQGLLSIAKASSRHITIQFDKITTIKSYSYT